MYRSHQNAGFTIVELLVTVAIIALIASIAIPRFAEFQKKSRDTGRIATTQQVKKALDLYWVDNRSYPQPAGGPCIDLVGWDGLGDSMSGPIQGAAGTYYYCTPTDPNGAFANLIGQSYGIRVRLEQDRTDTDTDGYCKTGVAVENYPDDWGSMPDCNF